MTRASEAESLPFLADDASIVAADVKLVNAYVHWKCLIPKSMPSDLRYLGEKMHLIRASPIIFFLH